MKSRINWQSINQSQKELGIIKRISFETFKQQWIEFYGKPQCGKDYFFLNHGLKDFYEDYMTSHSRNTKQYFEQISA